MHRYNNAIQRVDFAQVAVSDKDGEAFLNVFENTGVQNSLLDTSMGSQAASGRGVMVRTMTVQTLLDSYHIPHDFGVLSVDAEGLSYPIIHGTAPESDWGPRCGWNGAHLTRRRRGEWGDGATQGCWPRRTDRGL